MSEHINITTVAGRQRLLAKMENINGLIHQLELHVQNLEADLARERSINLERSRMEGGDEFATCMSIIRRVWVDGCSIYDKEIQRDIEKLGLSP